MARKCPICGGAAAPGTKWYPFDSERCKLIDLGKWLSEEYRVPGPEPAPEPEAEPEPEPEREPDPTRH